MAILSRPGRRGPLAAPLVVLAFVTPACGSARADADLPPTHHQVQATGLGASFWLPLTWSMQESSRGYVASGPEGTPSYYTTLTLQAARRADIPLEEQLRDSFTELEAVTVDVGPPQAIGPHLWVPYDVRFDAVKQARRRVGALLEVTDVIQPYVLDVAYGAPANLFDAEAHIFDLVLATIALSEPDQAVVNGQP